MSNPQKKRPVMGCCVDRKYGKGCTEETCMVLPGDRMCGDCVGFKRCSAIIGIKADEGVCDFFPRRFVQMEVP